MRKKYHILSCILFCSCPLFLFAQPTESTTGWRIIIGNDTCPDVTWGYTEEQTRQAFADLVASHLDEMNRTDAGPAENRDHFNMATTQEALDFAARYPARKEELIRRLREGRICMSPFLCNSLWGFQSMEGFIRTMYPARRLEREWNIPIDIAEHIELPSLPWGMATLLSGCGVRWVSVPFYDYDSSFKKLTNPPLFRFTGPDGSEIRVLMDAWASLHASYAQGSQILKEPQKIAGEWIPHYNQLGSLYPLKLIYASGTHSDISPSSNRQTRGFSESISNYNANRGTAATLVNGTLAQFCHAVDAQETKPPFLPAITGCFGHSWELWPVSLAETAAALRMHEQTYLAAEALAAIAGRTNSAWIESTRPERAKAEWFWAMLSDHAWNGTDLTNKRHNAELRRDWAKQLNGIATDLTNQAWHEIGLKNTNKCITVFNPLSFSRDNLAVCEVPDNVHNILENEKPIPSQWIEEDGKKKLVFAVSNVPAYGFKEYQMETNTQPVTGRNRDASDSVAELENSTYILKADNTLGGFCSLVHKPSGQELITGHSRSLCQTVFFDGKEHTMTNIQSRISAKGPVFAQLTQEGDIDAIHVTQKASLYAASDRIDFDLRIDKPVTATEQRLLNFFPLTDTKKNLRIETTGSVLRPYPQPEGDLLPGADTNRFAVQGFLEASPDNRVGVTVVPIEAFMLRLDQETPAFEILGNDQDYKEVIQDQDGVTHFRFRYSLRVHNPGYNQADAIRWSRSIITPMTAVQGALPAEIRNRAHLVIDPSEAVATCLKPSDEPGKNDWIVRVWETAGKNQMIQIKTDGCTEAMQTDLLERPLNKVSLANGSFQLPVRPQGLTSVRLR